MSGQIIGPIGVLPTASIFQQGFYFRSTNNQVSPTNYEFSTNTMIYPTVSAKGNNVGWLSGSAPSSSSDRDVTTDVRLRGISFNTAVYTFRIDLPSPGIYKCYLGMGDSGFAHRQRFQILDNAAVLQDVDFLDTVLSNQWGDASGVVRTSEAAWVSNNAPFIGTFSSTVLQFSFGNSAGVADANETITNIFVTS